MIIWAAQVKILILKQLLEICVLTVYAKTHAVSQSQDERFCHAGLVLRASKHWNRTHILHA